jgi:hypothetical protein
MQDWHRFPVEGRMATLFAMRERGLLTQDEYFRFSEQLGLISGQAEGRYRKWTGTENAIYDMHRQDLLRHGEYTKLLRTKHISRGAGYYRRRKFEAVHYQRPFRGWEKPRAKPKSRRSHHP